MIEVDLADERFCEFIKVTANSPTESTIARYVRRILLVSLMEPRDPYGWNGDPPAMNKFRKFMTAAEEDGFANENVADSMEYDFYPSEGIEKCLVPFLERLINVNTLR